jgi:hypothetical protein
MNEHNVNLHSTGDMTTPESENFGLGSDGKQCLQNRLWSHYVTQTKSIEITNTIFRLLKKTRHFIHQHAAITLGCRANFQLHNGNALASIDKLRFLYEWSISSLLFSHNIDYQHINITIRDHKSGSDGKKRGAFLYKTVEGFQLTTKTTRKLTGHRIIQPGNEILARKENSRQIPTVS